jgi:signal transduction histidine kinase
MLRPLNAVNEDRLPSVSRPLQALAAVLLVLILIGSARQLYLLRDAVMTNTERQISRLDMVFAEQTGRAIESIDLLLRNAIETLEDPHGPTDPPAFDELLRRRLAGLRQATEIILADANGQVIHASGSMAAGTVPPQGMALLRSYQAGKSGLLISEPFRTRDGGWTALLGRPMPGPNGLAGIALGAVNLAYFEEFYQAVDLTENGAISLHQRDGTLLARFPHVDAAIGTSFADAPPFKDVLATQQAGTVVMDSPVDGGTRVTAVRALRAYPLAVMVSVDQGQLLASWWQEVWFRIFVAVVVGTLTVGMLLRLSQRSRQVEQLVTSARATAVAAERSNRQLREQMNERQRAEAALRQAQRMEAIGQLTGGVAHDFNNLLTVLLGNLDMIDRARDLPASVQQRLAAASAAARRGATLTGHLLAFARRQPLQPQTVDLNVVANGMHYLLDSALGGRVSVTLRLEEALWPAVADPTQIELVILNLAINGRDAMPDGGTLSIRTANRLLDEPTEPEEPPAGAYVMVSVQDTGTGMTPEVRARVFEAFFTTKAPGAGSGLGLSQVINTARQTGGGVRIESALGKGTTVSVFLPRATGPAEQQVAPQFGEPTHGRSATVLLVDDDEAVRVVTGAMLKDLGYAVHEAASGVVALRVLETNMPVDLLMTDLAMPFMTGAQLAQAARARRPGLPVVFISGYADPEGLTGAVSMHRLVRKPFRPGELRQEIEAALGGAAVN